MEEKDKQSEFIKEEPTFYKIVWLYLTLVEPKPTSNSHLQKSFVMSSLLWSVVISSFSHWHEFSTMDLFEEQQVIHPWTQCVE